MAKKLTEFDLEPHWHLDFRDIVSLPEDRVVRVRFLVNTCAGMLIMALLTFVSWQLFARANIVAQQRFWDEKIASHRQEYARLQILLRDYMKDADRVKDAYDVVYSPFVPSRFILDIGRTLPGRMTVDMIGYADGTITIRGSLAESPERASRVLGGYIETLRRDSKIGPLCSDISAPSLERGQQNDQFNYELLFKLRSSSP